MDVLKNDCQGEQEIVYDPKSSAVTRVYVLVPEGTRMLIFSNPVDAQKRCPEGFKIFGAMLNVDVLEPRIASIPLEKIDWVYP
jgi:hypothetical protein